MTLIEDKYYRPVGTAVAAAAGLGVPGLFIPPLDATGVGATWTGMVVAIARKSGHEMNTAAAGKIVIAALGALGGTSSARRFSPGRPRRSCWPSRSPVSQR